MFTESFCETVLYLANNSKVSGHFRLAKTFDLLSKFHWNHKYRDVKRYCDGCLVLQNNTILNQKNFNDPQPLEVPLRRLGSISTDFILSIPCISNYFN